MRGLRSGSTPAHRRLLSAGEEGGAVAIIVAISIIAIFGMLVLTVDVGGLLLKRRAMVNASDAGALAAAKSCASTSDTLDPESRADIYAADNVVGLDTSPTNLIDKVGCDTKTGYVTAQYSNRQPLFFAGVLGFGGAGTVVTKATAAWGAASSGLAIPIVLDSGQLQGVCKVPDGVKIDDTCAFWYNNGDSSLGDANWGYMNLDEWGVAPSTNCSNAGSSNRNGWITNNYGSPLPLKGDPPGSQPTYVCGDTGHSSSDWMTLAGQEGQTKLFPVNDCSGQLDKSGAVSPCPSTPDKYDIIGFTSLYIQHVYKGNDPLAIGSTGASGTCTLSTTSLTNGQVKNLADSYGTNGCPPVAPDNIAAADVHITPKNGAEFAQCAPGDLSASCGYWYDAANRTITWRQPDTSNLKITYGWSMNGTPGACGIHPSDPNAICLVTQWKGFQTVPGTPGNGKNFGVESIVLCDRDLKSCPGQ